MYIMLKIAKEMNFLGKTFGGTGNVVVPLQRDR